MESPFKPNLGMATTEELLDELSVRWEIAQLDDLPMEVRARLMAMVKNFEACKSFFGPALLEYRTVDS